jgi:CheY-like chemotaxis protein
MFDLADELRGIVGILDGAGVAYALAGGLAVSIYATPRATQDIDILVAVADLERAIAGLQSLGFRTAGRSMVVADGRLEIQRLIKIDGRDLLPLDLMLPRDPELMNTLAARTEIVWQGTRLAIVTVDGLRRLKRLRDSAQDRADLEALGPDSA